MGFQLVMQETRNPKSRLVPIQECRCCPWPAIGFTAAGDNVGFRRLPDVAFAGAEGVDTTKLKACFSRRLLLPEGVDLFPKAALDDVLNADPPKTFSECMDVISKYMNDCCIPLSTSYSTYCSATLATLDSTFVIKSIIIISTEMIHSGARNYATAYSILPPLVKSQLGNIGENLLFWACYQMNGCKHKETLESYCGAECERVYVAFNAVAFICGVLDCQEGLDLLGSRSVICSNVVGMIVTTWFLTLTLDQHTWTFDYADKAMDILRGLANSQTFPQDVKSVIRSKVVGMSPTETGRVLLRQVVIFVTGDLPPLLDLPNLLPGPYQGRVPVENVISAMCYFSEVNDNMKRAIIAQRPVRWICRALAKIVKLGVWRNPLERVLQPFYPIFSYLELLFEDDTSDTLIADALRHRLLISIARSVAGNGRMIEPKGAYKVEAVPRLIARAAAREPIVLRLVCRAYELSVSGIRGQPDKRYVFSWYQLQYTVNVADEERILLDNVMGYVAPGKLTALMGTSGAGKTTLLNVLAQRTTSGVVSGDRFVNGQTLPNDFQSQTGYCQQMDTHTATDTVREALLNSAKLRQPASIPLAEKEAYVEECLRLCGLESHADAIVGSLGVEHRKRTTIGVELAAKPKLLLFLDEPTSGLDSKSSWAIIKFLQDLAQNGQAILCTIHQPSAELFQAFDRLLLLKKGGKMVYFGDLGDNATTLIRYFERNGSRHCEASENPAEFMLDVIGAGATAASQKDWPATWNESPKKVALEEEIQFIYSQGSSARPVASEIKGEFATSWMNQFNVLFARENRFRWRNTTYLRAKIMLNIVTGLFIGFTFYKADNSQQGSTNKLFAVFLPLIGCTTFINQLSVETIRARSVYETRERPSRMYHWSAFLTAHFLSEIFWNTLGSIFLFLCWYWTAGFPSSRAAYAFLAIGSMYPAFYTSIGITIAISSPTAQVASILTTFVVVFVLLFNGVMQPFSLLGWWKWMYHVTPFTYLVEGVVTNVMGGALSMKCVDHEFVQVDPPSGQDCGQYFETFINRAGGYLRDANASASCQFCPYDDADRFLQESFNMSYSHRWRNIGFLCAYVVLNVCAMYAFMYSLRIRRR